MGEKLPTVAVLMSTYNGEKYLREQLDSIFAQEGVEVKLFVRDDGSTDGTIPILKELGDKVNIDYGNNIGVGASFMDVLYNAPNNFDYYAFADQDDVWLKNKLVEGINIIRKKAKYNAPILYTSNQTIVDNDLKIIKERYNDKPRYSLVDAIEHCQLSGCTMIFNNKLKAMLSAERARPPKEYFRVKIHDTWLLCFTCCVGKVIYDNRSFILYRQHENNVVGIKGRDKKEQVRSYIDALFGRNALLRRRSKSAKQLRKSTELYSLNSGVNEILDLYINGRTIKGKIELMSTPTLNYYRNIRYKLIIAFGLI